MFKDFDYISPELLSTHLESSEKSSSQTQNTDLGASNLTEEMQDLRLRGHGDWQINELEKFRQIISWNFYAKKNSAVTNGIFSILSIRSPTYIS